MITRERLEELIKQKATIYITFADDCVVEDKLDEKKFNLMEKLNNGFGIKCGYPLDMLFETKEEAEFALRYQNITRTETLSLPTWEEFIKLEENSDYG